MIRIAICDDEEIVCSTIEAQVTEACRTLSIETETEVFFNGQTLINHIKRGEDYHILFLDIEMKPISGIDVSNYIRNTLFNDSIQIVYISGKSGYDRQLFEFRPFDFISKPVNEAYLIKTMSKYQRIYGTKDNLFKYRYGHDSYWVRLDKILYFKSRDRKVIIKTSDSEDEFYASLESIRKQIGNCGFIFPHKTFLVNYRFIKSFGPDSITMTNGDVIPIARSKKGEIASLRFVLENGK